MVFADLKNAFVLRRIFATHPEILTEAKAEAILAFLAACGIAVSDEARARIEACKDVATLDRWIARAATCASAEEVLAAA